MLKAVAILARWIARERFRLMLGACVLIAAGCGSGQTTRVDTSRTGAVAKANLAAGPVLQGEYVVWGEGGISSQQDDIATSDGDIKPLRVLVAAPGSRPRVVFEQPTSRARPEWWFGDFAGSAAGFAFVRAWSACFPPDYESCGVATDAGT